MDSISDVFSYMTPRLWFFGIIMPFLVALVITACIHPLIVKMAIKRHMTDNPDGRKLQRRPVPVMGGLAVYFGFVVGAGVVSMFFNSFALFTCIVAMTIMMYVGMIDDMVGLSPLLRIVLEVAVVAFIVKMDMVNLNDFHGLFGVGKLPVWLSLPLCAVACTGIINAVNMIDGVDGLSTGLCMFACLCFGVVFCASFDGTMSVAAALAAGALVPFFFHNVFGLKSKMFIGDSGTMMLGMLMSIFCMHLIDNTSPACFQHPRFGVVAFCLSVLSIPVFDTVRVMTSRILRGESPFTADRSHLHHLFVEIGFSHIGTTVLIISLNALNVTCWFVAYLLTGDPTVQFLVVVVVGFLNTSVFYYTVRRLPHTHPAYRFLKYLARKSHMEVGWAFLTMRKIMDRL